MRIIKSYLYQLECLDLELHNWMVYPCLYDNLRGLSYLFIRILRLLGPYTVVSEHVKAKGHKFRLEQKSLQFYR